MMPGPTRIQEEGEGASGRLARTILPVLLVGGLLLAHLEALARGPGHTGLLLALDHVFDLALATLAMALFTATGRWLLRRVRLEPDRDLDVLLYGAAVGPGVWSLLLLVLGLLGFLTPLALLVTVTGGAVVVRKELRQLPLLCRAAAGEIRDAMGDRLLLGFVGAVGALVALFLFLHGSAPPGDWDSLMYHLEIPRQWWAQGRIHVPEGNLHAAYTSLLQLLYVPFLAVGSDAAPALLNGLFALFLGLAAFQVGTRLFGPETGAFAAVLLWASTGFLLVAVTARIDTTLAFYLLLGQGAVALALVEPSAARTHLLRGAAVLGLAVGMKYHALAFTAALAPVALWALWAGEKAGPVRLRVFAVATAIFLVGALPWMLKNLVLLGEPFYPFFTDRMLQPWLADLYGTRSVPPGVDPGAFGSLGQAREPVDLVALFLSPERLTVEPEGAHFNMNPLFLLLPLWLLHLRRKEVTALAAPAILYAVGVAVVFSTINLRYLIPALPALTVVTSFFAVSALGRFVGPRARKAVLAVVAVLALVPTARSAYAWTVKAPVVEQALGSVSRQDYLQAGFGFYAGLAGTVNREAPEEGKVLLLWEARGFYMIPDHLPDNILTNWPLLRPYVEETGSCLEETGITHVLAATAAARYYEQRGADPGQLGLTSFLAFADRCLEPVRVGPAFGLYRTGREGGAAESSPTS